MRLRLVPLEEIQSADPQRPLDRNHFFLISLPTTAIPATAVKFHSYFLLVGGAKRLVRQHLAKQVEAAHLLLRSPWANWISICRPHTHFLSRL